MQVYRKQTGRGIRRFLLVVQGDPQTKSCSGLIVTVGSGSVRRVPDVRQILRQEMWQPVVPGDPTLDDLVTLVPALRRFRGIEVRLPGGETVWVRWRQWSSTNPAVQHLLTETTRALVIPDYEPDADFFLATQAVLLLRGEVLDPPRSAAAPDEAY